MSDTTIDLKIREIQHKNNLIKERVDLQKYLDILKKIDSKTIENLAFNLKTKYEYGNSVTYVTAQLVNSQIAQDVFSDMFFKVSARINEIERELLN